MHRASPFAVDGKGNSNIRIAKYVLVEIVCLRYIILRLRQESSKIAFHPAPYQVARNLSDGATKSGALRGLPAPLDEVQSNWLLLPTTLCLYRALGELIAMVLTVSI